MKKACDHFLALKPEKVANFIKKTQVRCSFHKHTSSDYNLCLSCGETRCDVSPDNCSQQHSDVNKHYVVLKLISFQIYCFYCGRNIDDILLDFQSAKSDARKVEKTYDLRDKIISLAEKSLTNKHDRKKGSGKELSEPYHGAEEKITNKQSKHKKDLPLRVFGLANIGNTCYFNSVLQCLYATPELHQLYNEFQFKDDANLIFKKFLKNSQKVYCPKTLFSLVGKSHKAFRGMDQQDAFELYVLLLNTLIESAQKKNQKGQPNISRIFGFTMASRLNCLSCGKVSWNMDFSLGLNVPVSKKASKRIQGLPSNEPISEQQIGHKGLHIPVYQPTGTFLDHFFDPELFTKANHFRCEQCEEANAVHKFYLKEAPVILTVNFKRFDNRGMKINSKVAIPRQLSIENVLLTKGNHRYQLYGGVVHSGSSSGGHYVAYTKRNDEWLYFSDSHYKAGGSFKTTQPYVVFYRRIQGEQNFSSYIKPEEKVYLENAPEEQMIEKKQQQGEKGQKKQVKDQSEEPHCKASSAITVPQEDTDP